MSAPSQFLAQEKFWANKAECEDAEYRYYAKLHRKVDGLVTLTSLKSDFNMTFSFVCASKVILT